MELTASVFDSDEFKKLKRKWYQKIQRKGFIDQEKEVGQNTYLVQSSEYPFRHHGELQREARLQYYLFISQFVATEQWANSRDRIVMQSHAEGLKIKEILLKLERRGLLCHRQTVRFIIRRFENKWKLRRWQKRELTSNRGIE
jgi:hypothetical protein